MAMDSYMKGVTAGAGKQVIPAKSAEEAKKDSVAKESVQKVSASKSSPKKNICS